MSVNIRVAMLAAACLLSGCADREKLNEAAGILNPDVAARNNERTARQHYDQSVANYRNCLAANPPNASACDGYRRIMEADERVLSAAVGRPRQ